MSATIRLAAADRALSSGRSEWAGLLLVQAILRRVRADVTLRLGNLQVVNKFDDGEERFAHDWMRQNERDMASLAWEMAAVRERRGLGSIKVLHQLGHPEKRKAVADYDEHERYNVRVGALTHAIAPDMPLYISLSISQNAIVLSPTCQTFSQVSALVHLLYKVAIESTFQKVSSVRHSQKSVP